MAALDNNLCKGNVVAGKAIKSECCFLLSVVKNGERWASVGRSRVKKKKEIIIFEIKVKK